jgi:hypothetical protein
MQRNKRAGDVGERMVTPQNVSSLSKGSSTLQRCLSGISLFNSTDSQELIKDL